MAISEDWSAMEWKFLVDKCLNATCLRFYQYGSHNWHTQDIESISIKCPNLQQLIMNLKMNANLQSWPLLAAPWTSLQDLTIHCHTKLGGIFESVELHLTLPNLARIFLTEDGEYLTQEREPSFLPDLEGCTKLEIAVFMHGFFRFGDDILPGDNLPLPPGLTNLNLMGSRFHEEFMNRINYEEIKKVLPRLQCFGACRIPEHLLVPII